MFSKIRMKKMRTCETNSFNMDAFVKVDVYDGVISFERFNQ